MTFAICNAISSVEIRQKQQQRAMLIDFKLKPLFSSVCQGEVTDLKDLKRFRVQWLPFNVLYSLFTIEVLFIVAFQISSSTLKDIFGMCHSFFWPNIIMLVVNVINC